MSFCLIVLLNSVDLLSFWLYNEGNEKYISETKEPLYKLRKKAVEFSNNHVKLLFFNRPDGCSDKYTVDPDDYVVSAVQGSVAGNRLQADHRSSASRNVSPVLPL